MPSIFTHTHFSYGYSNRKIGVAKGLVQHAKTGSFYCIFIREDLPEIYQDVLIAHCKRFWFEQHRGQPSAAVNNYMDAAFWACSIGSACFFLFRFLFCFRFQEYFFDPVSAVVACVSEISGIFEALRQSLHWLYQAYITVDWRNFDHLNIARANDAVSKHLFHASVLHLCLNASLVPVHSYTIQDCYAVLCQLLKFVSTLNSDSLYITRC